jgi:hypothetical protein
MGRRPHCPEERPHRPIVHLRPTKSILPTVHECKDSSNARTWNGTAISCHHDARQMPVRHAIANNATCRGEYSEPVGSNTISLVRAKFTPPHQLRRRLLLLATAARAADLTECKRTWLVCSRQAQLKRCLMQITKV